MSDPDKRQMYDDKRDNPYMRGGQMPGMPNEADYIEYALCVGWLEAVVGWVHWVDSPAWQAFLWACNMVGRAPLCIYFHRGQHIPISAALQ